jgi:tRNA (guanine-N7-)-methyltransferase
MQYPQTISKALFQEWCANKQAPTVLDIGCGRGRFLLDHALALPEHTILGIELRRSLVDWIQMVVRAEHIPNAWALFYTVVNGLDWIAPESIDYCTYLFPDPWPKLRHVKRRAFNAEFLQTLHRVLRVGGKVYLATDRPDVDMYQRKVLATDPRFEVSQEPWPFDFATDQQLFCLRKGIPFVQYSVVKAA